MLAGSDARINHGCIGANTFKMAVFYCPEKRVKMAIVKTDKQQEREWAIEDAALTLKSFARIKRDKPLLKAAREYLKKEIADSKKILKTT